MHRKWHNKLNSITDTMFLVLVISGVIMAVASTLGLLWVMLSVVFLIDPGNPYNAVAGGFLLKNSYVDQKDMLKQYPKPDNWKGTVRQWLRRVIATIKQRRVTARQSAFRIGQEVAKGRRDHLSRSQIADNCLANPLVTKGWENKPTHDEMKNLVGEIIHSRYVKNS